MVLGRWFFHPNAYTDPNTYSYPNAYPNSNAYPDSNTERFVQGWHYDLRYG
jgi:hypothetical protein